MHLKSLGSQATHARWARPLKHKGVTSDTKKIGAFLGESIHNLFVSQPTRIFAICVEVDDWLSWG